MKQFSFLMSLLLIITVGTIVSCSSKKTTDNFVPISENLYSQGADTTIKMKTFKLMKGDPKKIINSCGKEVTIRRSYLDSLTNDLDLTLQGKKVDEQLYKKVDGSSTIPTIIKDDSDNDGGNTIGGSRNGMDFWDWLPWLLLLLLLIAIPLWVLAFNNRRRSSRPGMENEETQQKFVPTGTTTAAFDERQSNAGLGQRVEIQIENYGGQAEVNSHNYHALYNNSKQEDRPQNVKVGVKNYNRIVPKNEESDHEKEGTVKVNIYN